MSRPPDWTGDGPPRPRAFQEPPREVDGSAAAALEALDLRLPEPLRALGRLDLVGPKRRWRIEQTLASRTRSLAVLVHGVHDPHNQSAILRTAEAFGVQEVHVTRLAEAPFQPAKGVTKNAHRWLDLVRHDDFEGAVEALRGRGMRVLASALDERALPLHEVDFSQPTALVVGNEREGLPPEAVAACDGAVIIPMLGLSQSLNVSVAAAVMVSAAIEQRRRAWGEVGDLSEDERMALRKRFYLAAAGRRVPAQLRAEIEALPDAAG